IDAPPNLSLFVGGDEGPVRELHRLYRGAIVVVHTRSEGRLLRAALAHLDGCPAQPVALRRRRRGPRARTAPALPRGHSRGAHPLGGPPPPRRARAPRWMPRPTCRSSSAATRAPCANCTGSTAGP